MNLSRIWSRCDAFLALGLILICVSPVLIPCALIYWSWRSYLRLTQWKDYLWTQMVLWWLLPWVTPQWGTWEMREERTIMASVSLPCQGCSMRWFLPKEREVAIAHITNCGKQKCPFVSQDISWLMDNSVQYGPQTVKAAESVVIPVYAPKKKHKNPDFPGRTLEDSEIQDVYPPLLHRRIKFK